jgi:hypothetical protein
MWAGKFDERRQPSRWRQKEWNMSVTLCTEPADNTGVHHRSSIEHPEWLSPEEVAQRAFDNPEGDMDDFGYSVFRTNYAGQANDIASLWMSKLQPVRPTLEQVKEAGSRWSVTAARHSVVLASGVPDEYSDIQLLLRRYAANRLEYNRSLFTAVTLMFPSATTLHDGFNRARAFATVELAHKRRLSSLMIQHVPAYGGSARPMHVHLLILPQIHGPLGFGELVPDLTCDRGQSILFEEWQAWK